MLRLPALDVSYRPGQDHLHCTGECCIANLYWVFGKFVYTVKKEKGIVILTSELLFDIQRSEHGEIRARFGVGVWREFTLAMPRQRNH